MSTLLGRLSRAASLALAGIVAAATAMRAPASAAAAEQDDDDWLYQSIPVLRTDGQVALSAFGRSGFVQLPSRSIVEWTPARVQAALLDADTGMLANAADLVEAIMGDDRVQGVMSTRTHGLLGLPVQHFGEDEQVKALEGVKASAGQPVIPGDWIRMFPEPELVQLMAWGLLLGVGLAERVPVDELQRRNRIAKLAANDNSEVERETPVLRVWHPRWLRHDWVQDKWFLTTADGEIEITPGDGRWILFMPYGSTRPWTQGAWRPIAFAFVLKQFALHDRARHSEVQGSPARIGVAPAGATDKARRKLLRDLRAMARDNSFVLPEGWDYKLVESQAKTYEIYGAQIEWADRAIAITLAGQFVTTEGTKGFSNGNIHAAIRRDLIQFTAEALATTLHDQGVVPWAIANYGSSKLAPWSRWDTTVPEDKETTAKAYAALGSAISSLDSALSPSGMRTQAPELASRFGVPLVALPPQTSKAPTISLAPTDVAKVVFVNEARASAGLGPLVLPTGAPDPDGMLTVEEFAAKRAAAAKPPPALAERNAAFAADMKDARDLGFKIPPRVVDVDELARLHNVPKWAEPIVPEAA